MTSVDVVTQHNYEIEANCLPVFFQLLANSKLRSLASSVIANHGEAHRVFGYRQGDLVLLGQAAHVQHEKTDRRSQEVPFSFLACHRATRLRSGWWWCRAGRGRVLRFGTVNPSEEQGGPAIEKAAWIVT